MLFRSKKYGGEGLPEDTFIVKCSGAGGQSFGAFIPKGLTLELVGDSNDVVASVAEDSVDIVINQQTLENSQKAQIEDIAKRKTGVTSDKITINVIK